MLDNIATLDDTDVLRAGTWSLLGRLLLAPPDDEVRDRLQGITASRDSNDSLQAAWAALAEATYNSSPEALHTEYQDLFIGVGGGEVTPYASWYLSGVLLDRPLVELRQDLVELGIERGEGSSEPEDHAGTVCEVMAFVILDEDVDFEWQKELFLRHVNSWMGRLFDDLGTAGAADYYRHVGALGKAFLELEQRYYAMSV